MTIEAFDKQNLKKVRAVINSALERAEEELGIELSIGNITYEADGSNFRTKLQGAVLTEGGDAMTQEARDFEFHAPMQGLSKDLLFTTFIHNGEQYKIVGWKPRSTKYPIACTSGDKSYKFPISLVQRLTKKEVA